MDSYLGDILHGVVRMTGHDRPGQDTVRIPKGIKRELSVDGDDLAPDGDTNGHGNASASTNGEVDQEMGGLGDPALALAHEGQLPGGGERHSRLRAEYDPDAEAEYYAGELPKPDLETLHHLFTLIPELHQQASPALYKLASSHTLAEVEYNESKPKIEREDTPPSILHSLSGGTGATVTDMNGDANPNSTTSGMDVDGLPKTMGRRHIPLRLGLGQGQGQVGTSGINSDIKPSRELERSRRRGDKPDDIQKHLMANGLLKLDKAGEGGESKKDKKHNLHWKYEDPAMIFRDVLG
jgi:transcriptional coactivator HFI1/ADA1